MVYPSRYRQAQKARQLVEWEPEPPAPKKAPRPKPAIAAPPVVEIEPDDDEKFLSWPGGLDPNHGVKKHGRYNTRDAP